MKRLPALVLALCLVLSLTPGAAASSGSMNMYANSDFIEKEQPALSEETKELINQYHSDNSTANYLALREVVIKNYNEVLERKEDKLAELKVETAGKSGGEEIVAEMEEIVQDMYITYWDRINSSMLRFTDPRLPDWHIAEAARYEYIPVMGAGESIYIKRTSVTNAEYAEYIAATGAAAPSNWTNGSYPAGEDSYPVNFVSYEDALGYCAWLTAEDGVNTYRLPSESEWELAAGHMPKDADFNCGVNNGRTSVYEYADVTRGAHGAVDFWGNVWEWTSTVRSTDGDSTILGVKGGAWNSERTDCRTEYRKEGRDSSQGYVDVGFRVIQVLNGEEPEQQVNLTTLAAPSVTATASSDSSVTLSWQAVDGATEYQIFSYSEEDSLVQMLDCVSTTSSTITGLEPNTTYSYIVQPLSYTCIGDNVSGEYAVSATTLSAGETTSTFTDVASDAWYAEAVQFVVENGLMNGTSADTFDPDSELTRAQLVTILYRAEGSPSYVHFATFSDLSDGSWYGDAVLWAADVGIVNGYENGTFGPDNPVKREQIAAILYRYAEYKGYDVSFDESAGKVSAFSDYADISAYAVHNIQWAYASNIMTGTTSATISPQGDTTRAQFATLLLRFTTLYSA